MTLTPFSRPLFPAFSRPLFPLTLFPFFQREMEEYLNNSKNDLQNNELELRALQTEVEVLKYDINNFKSKGVSDAAKESQLANLELKIKNREKI